MQEYVEIKSSCDVTNKQKLKDEIKESCLRILRLQSNDKNARVLIEWHINGIRHTEFTNLY